MKKYLVFIMVFLLLPSSIVCADGMGSVCLGPFLSVVWYEPAKRPYLTIDDKGPFLFEQKTVPARLIINDLDLQKIHKVKVHFDGEIVESWDLDFNKLYTDMVYIWRSTGAWRMEPITNGKCERPATNGQ